MIVGAKEPFSVQPGNWAVALRIAPAWKEDIWMVAFQYFGLLDAVNLSGVPPSVAEILVGAPPATSA